MPPRQPSRLPKGAGETDRAATDQGGEQTALDRAKNILNERLPMTTSDNVRSVLLQEAQVWATIALIEELRDQRPH